MWGRALKRASPRGNPSHMDLCFSCLPIHIHFLYKLCLVVLSYLSVPMPCRCFLVCIHLCWVFSGLSQTMGYTAWHCLHNFWWFCEVWLVCELAGYMLILYTHIMNTKYGQRAQFISMCVSNVDHKWAVIFYFRKRRKNLHSQVEYFFQLCQISYMTLVLRLILPLLILKAF